LGRGPSRVRIKAVDLYERVEAIIRVADFIEISKGAEIIFVSRGWIDTCPGQMDWPERGHPYIKTTTKVHWAVQENRG
jgi:hypothetical protein